MESTILKMLMWAVPVITVIQHFKKYDNDNFTDADVDVTFL